MVCGVLWDLGVYEVEVGGLEIWVVYGAIVVLDGVLDMSLLEVADSQQQETKGEFESRNS